MPQDWSSSHRELEDRLVYLINMTTVQCSKKEHQSTSHGIRKGCLGVL